MRHMPMCITQPSTPRHRRLLWIRWPARPAQGERCRPGLVLQECRQVRPMPAGLAARAAAPASAQPEADRAAVQRQAGSAGSAVTSAAEQAGTQRVLEPGRLPPQRWSLAASPCRPSRPASAQCSRRAAGSLPRCSCRSSRHPFCRTRSPIRSASPPSKPSPSPIRRRPRTATQQAARWGMVLGRSACRSRPASSCWGWASAPPCSPAREPSGSKRRSIAPLPGSQPRPRSPAQASP